MDNTSWTCSTICKGHAAINLTNGIIYTRLLLVSVLYCSVEDPHLKKLNESGCKKNQLSKIYKEKGFKRLTICFLLVFVFVISIFYILEM